MRESRHGSRAHPRCVRRRNRRRTHRHGRRRPHDPNARAVLRSTSPCCDIERPSGQCRHETRRRDRASPSQDGEPSARVVPVHRLRSGRLLRGPDSQGPRKRRHRAELPQDRPRVRTPPDRRATHRSRLRAARRACTLARWQGQTPPAGSARGCRQDRAHHHPGSRG